MPPPAPVLVGRKPFARLATTQAPVFRNPFLTAFCYGLLLGPMTLPCAGPADRQRAGAGGRQHRVAHGRAALLHRVRPRVRLAAGGAAAAGGAGPAPPDALVGRSLRAARAGSRR